MIISKIGCKSFKVRLFVWTMYVVLLAGSVTMIYPFWLMISGTTKSSVDTPDAELIPGFLINEKALYQKDSEAFFNEPLGLGAAQYAFCRYIPSFRNLAPPGKVNQRLVDEWKNFLSSTRIPFYYYNLAYMSAGGGIMPYNYRKFKTILYEQYNGDIRKLNREMGTGYISWNTFRIPSSGCFLGRYNIPLNNMIESKFIEFKEKQPVDERFYVNLEGYYRYSFLVPRYSKNIENYNKAHGTDYKSWDEVKLTETFPSGLSKVEQQDWETFVRMAINLLWIKADESAKSAWQEYLREKYRDISSLNKIYGAEYKAFSEIPLVKEPLVYDMATSDWDYFIQGWKHPESGVKYMLPSDKIRLQSSDFMFRDYLRGKYGSIEKNNSMLNTGYKNWSDIIPPQEDLRYMSMQAKTNSLKWEYVKRNYLSVLEYIVLHGNALFNTMVYCGLAVLSALIVNPLAAYALSRYKPPSAYKVLLFMMLTMAFPPMVTQIPAFLMLREFHLLNTFWALILPGLANGYSIFMLKGFFDSLPQELYESASMDGAGEIRIFLQITMSLSKPILAVMALGAFTGAYTNFMMALLICQDQSMWTIMPWLYQMQQRSGQGIIFTALVLASIPTFIIFVLCQNLIMKGIVVPVEK